MYIFLIYIFVLDICSQHLGNICQLEGFCTPFRHKVKKCTFCNISFYIYIYLYWIYAANIWRTYMSIEFIYCSRAQLSRGPTVHFFRADNWAPDSWAPGPNCPGPNCPLFGGGQLGPVAETLQLKCIPQMLAVFIQYEYIQGVFFHWYPPKKLKYGKPRLGESTLT